MINAGRYCSRKRYSSNEVFSRLKTKKKINEEEEGEDVRKYF